MEQRTYNTDRNKQTADIAFVLCQLTANTVSTSSGYHLLFRPAL